MNPREIFKTIDQSLGVDQSVPVDVENPASDLTVSTYETKRMIKANEGTPASPIEEQDLLDDFTFARKSQQMIIESVGEALQEAIAAAVATGSPEGFSAVATLMGQMTQAHKGLIDLYRIAKKTTEKPKDSPGTPEQLNNTLPNMIVATTQEIFEMIKKAKSKTIENE